jgi:hypothetical protein
MNKYTLFWRTGNRQVVTGPDAASAMNNAGIGRGALAALDFFAEGEVHGYVWDKASRSWRTAVEAPDTALR